MPSFFLPRRGLPLLAALGLAGCASLPPDPDLAALNADAAPFTQGALRRADSPERQHTLARRAEDLLAQPLTMDSALQLALARSDALQALLARHEAEAVDAARAARLPDPVLTLERLRSGESLEIGRLLSIGLLDLLTWPQRQASGQRQIDRIALQQSAAVVDQLARVRQAWVMAVAARQQLAQAERVADAADAGAELARRMHAAGNFNALTRAREQSFHAEAQARLSQARHAALARREGLVRALGLDEAQATRLQLPDALPPPPAQAPDEASLRRQAGQGRLDLRLAQAALDEATSAQGLGRLTSLTDIELGLRRDSHFEPGARARARGGELSIRLPLFDAGALQRGALDARSRAAAFALQAAIAEAGSQLRESLSAWHSSREVARRYREELLPLRQTMADETLLRYNGMLIGLFELLADAREQAATVMASIAADEQFWLADAALQATLLGRPLLADAPAAAALPTGRGDSAAAAH